MEEKKLTDEEIVKALKFAIAQGEPDGIGFWNSDMKWCEFSMSDVLDLIYRLQDEKQKVVQDYYCEAQHCDVQKDIIAKQKAEIERLTELQSRGGYRVAELGIENDELRKQVEELTKENERLKKFEMHRIKAMKKDKDEIERLTADLISMDREQECYITTIKDLNKQIDEFVKIARVSDTKKLVDEIKQQAVKDTAKEICEMIDGTCISSKGYLCSIISKRYCVEVE